MFYEIGCWMVKYLTSKLIAAVMRLWECYNGGRNGYIRQDRIRNEIIREKMEMCSAKTCRLEVDEESVHSLIIRGKGETKESYKL